MHGRNSRKTHFGGGIQTIDVAKIWSSDWINPIGQKKKNMIIHDTYEVCEKSQPHLTKKVLLIPTGVSRTFMKISIKMPAKAPALDY
jgi:hypothetical protein